MEAKLTEAVHYSLDNYLYHNATFLAEVRTPSLTRMTARPHRDTSAAPPRSEPQR